MTDNEKGIRSLDRILVIANRLPITVTEKEGQFKFKESVGGLVTGLSAYLDSLKGSSFFKLNYLWVGWSGITVDDKARQEELKSKMITEFNAQPVFLSEDAMDKFYHGFCNKTIWPLFHSFPSYVLYDETSWIHYKLVNEIFCDAVLKVVRPGDMIWIHDYHLMLLPRLLREKIPDLSIGFFLHIPFPSFEIFRLLPRKWSDEILKGLLGADLIGFHTYDYTQYFLRGVLRILGYDHDMGQIIIGGHVAKADTFPMGIDFERFCNAASCPAVEKEKQKLKKTLAPFKVILSIDRLDYSKGITKRLEGYELFLEKNPEWHKKVILVLVVVPSRVGVQHYVQIKNQIDELVGNINGKFGAVDWTPILYQYKYVPFYPLVALYSISDVALITPLRDGMNLIAKEYIASKPDKTGVLILSEMAGAAEEMREAVIINPNNREEIAEALKEALQMPVDEQIRRNEVIQHRLARYNVIRWASDFLKELSSVKELQRKYATYLLSDEMKNQLTKEYKNSQRQLLFLDYDGTLVPFASKPQFAKPNDHILNLLKNLSENPKTELVLISGRDKYTIQEWFGMLNINFVAEHGIWIHDRGGDWSLIKPLTNDWIPEIRAKIEVYVDRLPGSFIEQKEYSLVWHYRNTDPEMAPILAKELTDNLISFTANIDLQVSQGSKVVEIRNAGVNKGTAALHWLSKDNYDFIMAIGDDWTDEDLFKTLFDHAYTIKVGVPQSYARFNVRSYKDVLKLLEEMTR